MGVDTRITLPAEARVKDVASVIGASVGLPKRMEQSWVVVDGVCVVGFPPDAHLAMCCNIEWGGGTVPGLKRGCLMYHFESEDGTRCLLPRSRAEHIALGRRLVGFFGGMVDYNDCDSIDADYVRARQCDISAEDGDDWVHLQKRLLAVEPITAGEIEDCREHAAYKD